MIFGFSLPGIPLWLKGASEKKVKGETGAVSRSGFDPGIDGFAIEGDASLGVFDADEAAVHWDDGVGLALAMIDPGLKPALHVYEVEKTMQEEMKTRKTGEWVRKGGMAFGVLDYFYANQPLLPGKTKRKYRLKFKKGKRERDWNRYYGQRILDCRTASVASAIAWAAVLRSIPERWLPEAIVLDPVRRELERMALFDHIDLRLELRMPCPGGADWIFQNTLEQWEDLRRWLDEGRPRPVRLVGRTSGGVHDHQVIAYDYEETGEGIWTISLYDPEMQEAGTIRIDSGKGGLDSGGGIEYGDLEQLVGFFCVDYAPVPPPISFIDRVVGMIFPRSQKQRFQRD